MLSVNPLKSEREPLIKGITRLNPITVNEQTYNCTKVNCAKGGTKGIHKSSNLLVAGSANNSRR